MSFGLSASDVVVVGQLICRITSAIRNARLEYQELIRELESLKKALNHIDRLGQSDGINEIKCAALTCRYPLEYFLAKIQGYENSLGLRSIDGTLKKLSNRFHWGLGPTDEVNRLRDYLNIHVDSINMMLATKGLEQLDLVLSRTDEAHEELRNYFGRSSTELSKVENSVQAQALAVKENKTLISRLLWMIGQDVITPLRTLNQLVAKVCVTTQEICSIMIAERANSIHIATKFTWLQDSVRVEDTLGRIFSFASKCSIKALNAEIRKRFEQGPGKQEVLIRDYEIFDAKGFEPCAFHG